MRYRRLGRTGIVVSELCLGAMMFGEWGNTDESESPDAASRTRRGDQLHRHRRRVRARRVEEIVGKALKGRRDDVVLATKFTTQMRAGPNTWGNSRRWIMTESRTACAGSDRLHRPLPAHRPDPTPTSTRRSGAVRPDPPGQGSRDRHLRVSGGAAREAQWVSERRGRERFATEQLSYSILARQAEAAVLPTAERYGDRRDRVQPAQRGLARGPYRRGEPAAPDSRAARHPAYFDHGDESIAERKFDAVEQLEVGGGGRAHPAAARLGFVVAHRP
jgi:aryl-alcohol dehydrogenase-like predicted oxidoreductase